jgi:hypothetical protein
METSKQNRSLTDSELLRELLNCFYYNGSGLEWSYVEGTSIGEVLSPAMDARLQKIKANATVDLTAEKEA